jgi:hypothetical protein
VDFPPFASSRLRAAERGRMIFQFGEARAVTAPNGPLSNFTSQPDHQHANSSTAQNGCQRT